MASDLEISKLKLSGEVRNLKDCTARASIDNINNSIGQANGIASLDEKGHISSDQLDTTYIAQNISLSEDDIEDIFED